MKRTTVRLDEHLLNEAKARAASRGITLTRLVEQALRKTLENEDRLETRRRRVDLPTFYGEGGTRPGIDISDSKALWDMLDDEVGDLNKLR